MQTAAMQTRQEVRGAASGPLEGGFEAEALVWLLANLANLYRRPFDAELVLKRFPPPIDLPTLIEALEALGLKAGLARWPEEDSSSLPLPAVALVTGDGQTAGENAASPVPIGITPALIVQHGDHTLAWVKPGERTPHPCPWTLPAPSARRSCC